ncbi:MAG: hypothetical protein HFJ27_04715 [Clostridia bacterium]|nr:hypothetical protein [Clostridia bacterium]
MKKRQMALVAIVMLGIMILPIHTQAVLQANPNTNGKKVDALEGWIRNIRSMENENASMGLHETIDAKTLKSTSGSNNIDVHMIKSTEWGTVAILSASSYGNTKKMHESEIKSTTGNKSGIYMPLTREWTAGGIGGRITHTLGSIDGKYYTYYNNSSDMKVGDALGTATSQNKGCNAWHDAGNVNWSEYGHAGCMRSDGGRLFNATFIHNNDASLSRAAVVCGEGI